MAASIYTCEKHGSDCIVTFTTRDCPACELQTKVDDLTQEKDGLEREKRQLEDRIEELESDDA